MLLRITDESRELFRLDASAPSRREAPSAPFAQRVPARGEQVVLTDAATGVQSIYHIIQIQHSLGVDPESGLPDVLGIEVQVRLVTQQSGFNPLASGAP
jgi:hypothetical protein